MVKGLALVMALSAVALIAWTLVAHRGRLSGFLARLLWFIGVCCVPFPAVLMSAAVGLVTAIVFTLRSTPYLMVLLPAVGVTCVIAGVVIFGVLLVSDVRSRLHRVVERAFRAGDVMFNQGDFPDRLYLIGQGQVEVTEETRDYFTSLLAYLPSWKERVFEDCRRRAAAPGPPRPQAESPIRTSQGPELPEDER
jgi:hypothetical protein